MISSNSHIDKLSIHHIGNKTNGEDLQLSDTITDVRDSQMRELLAKYFLSSFNSEEYYAFTFTNEDFRLNPVYQFVTAIFDSRKDLHANSINIAKHLFEVSLHPNIKPGDLFVVYIPTIQVDGLETDAIGIFKSENRQPFLKISPIDNHFTIEYEDGINTDKLDKGCLVLNTAADAGYKVKIVDKTNKATDAQYWKDVFLMLKPAADEFTFTKQFLTVTKNYITKQYAEEFSVDKTDQIDLLNRSVEYFKTHDTFEKKEFEEEVLFHPETIESFRKFNSAYQEKNDVDIEDSFSISSSAVKYQARVFKSVLKLDNNFHIYIHGDKELIEKGTDKDGRKYYKIYYDTEK